MSFPKKALILLFGGTSETAPLARRLAEAGFDVLVSTATRIPLAVGRHARIRRRCGRLDAAALTALVRERGVRALVDAAHPYAEALHQTVRAVADRLHLPLLRYRRRSTAATDARRFSDAKPRAPHTGQDRGRQPCVHWVADHDAAAALACSFGCPVLLTTGSTRLTPYVAAARRADVPLAARVLSQPDALAACRAAGLPRSRVIAGRGPFSKAQNLAHIRRFQAGVVVTKDSGRAGGFPAKAAAAREARCRLVVVRRPAEQAGLTFDRPQALVAHLRRQGAALFR